MSYLGNPLAPITTTTIPPATKAHPRTGGTGTLLVSLVSA